MRFIPAFAVIAVLLFFGCSAEKAPFATDTKEKYILVYSSSALADAVGELASSYEKETGCRVDVLTGGSAHQYRAVQVNKQGDIIFAIVGEYVDKLKSEGLVTDIYLIGYDRLAYFVSYGNPLGINGELKWLTNSNVRSMIGSVLTSGAGEETHRTLQSAGVLDEVFENVIGLASDSKQLLKAVKDNKADMAVDWLSLKYNPEAKGTQAIPIDSDYFRKVPVKAGLLNFSSEKECSKGFVELSISEKGKQMFSKYGIEY